MPFDKWLAGPLQDIFVDVLSENTVRKRGWLSVSETSNIREAFLSGKVHWSQPWLLMMVELWASQVLDRQV